jgi:hypothetical protein
MSDKPYQNGATNKHVDPVPLLKSVLHFGPCTYHRIWNN